MSDSTLNCFVGRGTTTQRLAFTPSVPTPASGPSHGYLWWDTTLQAEYAWDVLSSAWVAVGGGGSGTVTHTGSLTSGQLVVGNGTADIAVGNLSGDISTSGSGVTTIGALKVATGMIQASAVTYAKIQNVSANSKLLGSSATGSGAAPSELTLGTNLSMSGSTLNAAGGSGNITSTGAEGSEPGSPSSGDLYFPNNGIWQERYSGSAWVPWGPIFPLVDPALQSFTWTNQGTTTLTTTQGGIYIEDATAGSLNLRVQQKAAPSTPYTITTAWLPQLTADNSSGMGVGFRESSSGKLIIFAVRYSNQINLTVDKYTNPTTFSANYTNQAIPALSAPVFLRIADNGTNRICSWSTDGQNFRVLHTVGRTDFLTADQVWFGLYINTVRTAGTLLSWREA